MKHALSLSRLLLTLAALLALGGCGVRSEEVSPYPVIDTGYWPAEVSSLAEPLWLDNERIIFASTESLAPGKGPHSVKVLNITTREIKSTRFHTAFCVRNGVALFQEKDEASGKTTDYRGTLEENHQEPKPADNVRFDSVFNCDWVPKLSSPPGGVVPWRSNLLGTNYIEVLEWRAATGEDRGPEGKRRYHRDENDPGRDIPFGGVSYSEFLDAYVISHGYYNPKWPETRAFWILRRNGDLKEVPYPKTMLEGRNDVYPLKTGYLVQYDDGKYTETDPGERGLHLMRGENVQRLLVGSVHGVHISPDGCKAAFVHARNTNEYFSFSPKKPYRTVKLINFCQGGATP